MFFSSLDAVRASLSKKYLDWAEVLPRFGGGPVARLQRIRERQREDAAHAQERTSAPDGISLDFIKFRMFELYQFEVYEELERSLLKVFPQLRESFNRHHIIELRHLAESASEGSWSAIGIIAAKQALWVSDIVYIDPRLPEDVWYIEVSLHKILPSIIALTFDVNLTEQAAQNLRSIQSRSYLPDVQFHQWVPWSSRQFNHTTIRAEAVKAHQVLKWIDELHITVEASIRPLTFGYFSSLRHPRENSLPSIEVFSISGVASEMSREQYDSWARKCRGWLDSFGFSTLIPDFVYRSPSVILAFQDYLWAANNKYKTKSRFPHLLLFENLYLPSCTENKSDAEDKRAKLVTEVNDLLDKLTPYLLILEFLDMTKKQIGQSKKLIFKRMSRKRRLTQDILLNESLHHEQTLISTIVAEYRHLRPFLEREEATLSSLVREVLSKDERRVWSLPVSLHEAIDFSLERVQHQINQAQNTFSNYLILRNMAAIYWLQFIAALASVVGIIIAVIALIGLEEVRVFIQSVFTLLKGGT